MLSFTVPTQKKGWFARLGLTILPMFSLLFTAASPVPASAESLSSWQRVKPADPSSRQVLLDKKPQRCQQLHQCAMRFNGENQWIELHNFRGFDTPAYTLETKFNWTGDGSPIPAGHGNLSGGIPFITIGGSTQSSADPDISLFFGIQASTHTLMVAFEAAPSAPGEAGKQYVLVGDTQIAQDQWHHAAATYDGQTLSLFLDGSLDSQLTLEAPALPQLVSTRDVYLAAALPYQDKGLGFFKGELDEVRLWEVARSQTELQENVDVDGIEDPNLIGYWSMNEGNGLVISDASEQGLHGRAFNGPTWVDGSTLALSTSETAASSTLASSSSLAPYTPDLVSPADGAVNLSTSPTLNVSVTDPDSQNLTVTFYGRPAPAVHRPEFTVVILPDTQKYTTLALRSLGIFGIQTQWIVDHQSAQNIVFVGHLGDTVDSWDAYTQWNISSTAMAKLEPPGIPYGIGIGNCDEDNYGDPPVATTYFNSFFPASRFAGRSYYGGAYNNDNGNSYQLFSASGMDFIVLDLKYNLSTVPDQAQAVLGWAHGLLQTNNTRRAIVLSHYMLDINNNLSPDGSEIYSALKDSSKLFLMMGGHVDTEGRRQDPANDGHAIYSLRSDYQTRANGGNGWLRLLRFSPETNKIYVQTYSPYIDQYETDADSQFALDYDMGGAAFQTVGSVSVASGSNASINWPGRLPDSKYDWYVAVSDGTSTTYSPVWGFTTASGPTAPSITTQPVDAAVNAGQAATFTAHASGTPAPTVQWQVSTDSGSTWSNIAGATSETLSFTAQAADNGKQYRAVFTNSGGSANTNSATLAVFTSPIITLQPASQTVNAGQTVSFTSASTGYPAPTVQWQVSTDNGGTWNNISGATSGTYAFTAQGIDNGKQYRAVFTNAAGSATSNAANLTVYFAPSVTTQPSNQTVNAGQSASFTAAASGFPSPTVQWQLSTDGGATWNNITGATSNTYSLIAQSADNGKRFHAVFTNLLGSATSAAAVLTVTTGPIVTIQPASQVVVSGQAASFTAAASGSPTPTVQWQVSADSGATWINIPGATSSTYSFTAQAADNGKQYHAVFTNLLGSATSNSALLTVQTPPVITTQPASQTVNAGETASFTAAATGSPAPTVQWQVSLDSGSTWSNISGATSATYSFTTIAADNGKQYRAVFTNAAGSATTVSAALTVYTAPVVTTQPGNQTLIAGQIASFTAAASGYPAPTLQWQVSTDNGATWSNIVGATSNTYSFTAQATDNARQYHAVFSNAAGSATTNAAVLNVYVPPTITTQPSSQTVNAGQTASFTAAATGTPAPTVRWQLSIDHGGTWTDISGANFATYSFPAQATDDGKQYRAVFTNAGGSATTNGAILTVYSAPIVTGQPSSLTEIAGQLASFSASASGNPTPAVQWQVSADSGATWSNIAGATSGTYSFTAQAADNGKQYHAVFTNLLGSATSNSALLTVQTPPVITTQPTSQTVNAGQTASFTAAATGSPAPAVQWQVSLDSGSTWTDIPGATFTTYSFTAQAADNGKQYRAVFTNSGGSANSNSAVLTVQTPPIITTQPASQTVNAGQTVSFTSASTGYPDPTVQWQVSTDGSTWSNITGATSNTYAFTAQAADNGKQYRAIFTNLLGSANSNSALLTVQTPPIVTTQPTNQTVNAGQTASFAAAATGSPAPTVQWQVSSDSGSTWSNIGGATSETLSFTAQAADNGKQYRAVFTNPAGSATTNSAALTVYTAPVVTTQPGNQTLIAGQTASFTAAASGFPAPTVQWQVSTDNGATWTDIPGATSSTYSFTAQASDNARQYHAVFSNTAGSAITNAAVLNVNSDLIFKDGFDSCNASAWTGGTVNSAALMFNTSSGRNSTCGMAVSIVNGAAAYVVDPSPNAEGQFRARFYLNPSTLKMARNDISTVFAGYNTSGQETLVVQVRPSSNAYQFRAGALRASRKWIYTSWSTFGTGWHVVEINWVSATAAGANNGSLAFWLDGIQTGSVTSIDNDLQKIDQVALGAVSGIDSTITGTFFIEAYESRRLTYIGP